MARLTGRFTPQKRCDLFLNNQVESAPLGLKRQKPKSEILIGF